MARLTAEERRQVPPGKFGLPDQREYLLNDVKHARLAIPMVEKYGTPSEQKKVLNRIHRLYPHVRIAALQDRH